MRKKFIKLTSLLLMSMVLLYGCDYGNIAKIDDSITNIDGVTISITSTNEKKAFVHNIDNDLLIERFGELGELSTIEVSLEGTVSISSLPTNATAMVKENGNSHVKAINEVASYYTDFFILKIKMPTTAKKINNLDGNGPRTIDTSNSVKDGFYIHKIEWLFGDVTASNWSIAGDTSTNENYLYIGFIDEANETIAQYFVHIQYNISFV